MALPEPVERYLAHALPAGPPPGPAVRLRMTGRIKLGPWLPFAAEEQCDGRSFVWRARVGPLHVIDRFAGGTGAMEGRLFGRRTLFAAGGEDVSRSSAGRAALEAIWAPGALRSERGVRCARCPTRSSSPRGTFRPSGPRCASESAPTARCAR